MNWFLPVPDCSTLRSFLSSSIRAAMTELHTLGAYTHQIYFSVLEAEKSKTNVLANSVSVGGPLPSS